MRVRSVFAATMAMVAFSAADVSHAATITFDSVGDTGTFHYGALVDGASLCADVTYTLASWQGASAVFNVAATNCSTGAGSGQQPNRLVSFGVGVVDPDLISADVPGSGEWDATADTNLPGYGAVDLCSYAGPNCSGGGSLGVYMGATDHFDLTLMFSSGVGSESPVTFSGPFESKWQSVGISGSGVNVDACLEGANCALNPVPEPGTLALLSVAAAGFGVARRRRAA